MNPARWMNRRGYVFGARMTHVAAALVLALSLLFASSSPAVTGNSAESSFEDRAAAEKASRSRYRKLEVASLIVISIAGAGTAYWAMRRKNH